MPYVVPADGTRTGDAWAAEAAASGGRGTHRITHAGTVTPPQEVSNLLRLTDDEPAVVRRRVVYLNDQPVEQADSYYPSPIALGTPLSEVRKIPGGAVTLLAKLGHVGKKVQEDVTARRPNDQELDLFGIEEGEPVLTLTRLISTDEDRPIQVDILVTPAKFRQYRYELRIE